jgi:hypothetical protein
MILHTRTAGDSDFTVDQYAQVAFTSAYYGKIEHNHSDPRNLVNTPSIYKWLERQQHIPDIFISNYKPIRPE